MVTIPVRVSEELADRLVTMNCGRNGSVRMNRFVLERKWSDDV